MKITNLLLITFGIMSCSGNEQILQDEEDSKTVIEAVIPSYEKSTVSRTIVDLSSKNVIWDSGDEIGLYANDGNFAASARFKILNGGSNVGTFVNKFFKLNSNQDYYSLYPYDYSADIDHAILNYEGQKQTQNNATSQLAQYNYLFGSLKTDGTGKGSIDFHLVGALVEVDLQVAAGTYSGIDFTSSSKSFITRGELNMENGIFTPTTTTKTFSISFGPGIKLETDGVLTFYFMLPPTDLSGSKISLNLHNTGSTSYPSSFTGEKIESGKYYSYSCNASKPGSSIGINLEDDQMVEDEYDINAHY